MKRKFAVRQFLCRFIINHGEKRPFHEGIPPLKRYWVPGWSSVGHGHCKPFSRNSFICYSCKSRPHFAGLRENVFNDIIFHFISKPLRQFENNGGISPSPSPVVPQPFSHAEPSARYIRRSRPSLQNRRRAEQRRQAQQSRSKIYPERPENQDS